MSERELAMTVAVAVFAAGGVVGFLSRRLPMSAWAALLMPVALPAVGLVLNEAFC
jgi:hypothetical protein